MMEARLESLFKKKDEYQVLDKFVGSTLAGKKYKPLFPYYADVSVSLKIETTVQLYWLNQNQKILIHKLYHSVM